MTTRKIFCREGERWIRKKKIVINKDEVYWFGENNRRTGDVILKTQSGNLRPCGESSKKLNAIKLKGVEFKVDLPEQFKYQLGKDSGEDLSLRKQEIGEISKEKLTECESDTGIEVTGEMMQSQEDEMPHQKERSSSTSTRKQKQKNKGEMKDSNKRENNAQIDTEVAKTEEAVKLSNDLEKKRNDKDTFINKEPLSCKNGQNGLQLCSQDCNNTEKCQLDENIPYYRKPEFSMIIENIKKKVTDVMDRNYSKHLQQLIKMASSDSCQLVVYLTLPENRFEDCLNENMDLTISTLWLTIISKACQSTFHGCNKHVVMLVLSSEFWILTIPSILSDAAFDNEKCQFIDLLVFAATTMNFYTSEESVFKHFENIPMSDDAKKYMTSIFDATKAKPIGSWYDTDSCIEVNNNRFNENVLPLPHDLDESFPPFLRENVLVGSYSSADDYLDTHFYLLKENIVSHFRKAITSYRTKVYGEACRIHTNVIAVERYFGINGISIKFLFPSKDHQQQNRLNEHSDLCLSLNDFDTVEFATVTSVESKENGECLVNATLLDCNFSSVVVGSRYVVAESGKLGYIHRQILQALKDQKSVSLLNRIVHAEKTITPPSYIDKSTVIDLMPLISLPEEDAAAKSKCSVKRKVEVLSSWSKCNSLSVTFASAVALEETLQKELSLVHGSKERGKSFVTNLLKLLDFNKIIWRGEKCRPLLVMCESNKMFEELNTEIKMFNDNVIALCENIHSAPRRNSTMFEKAVGRFGKHIENILKDIQFCESHPLQAMELRDIVQHGKQDLLKENRLKEWLYLTPGTSYVYKKENTDLYNSYEKVMANRQQQNKDGIEYFEKIACQMLKDSTGMTDLEAKNIKDVWSLNLSDRWNLAQRWMNNYITVLKKKLNTQKTEYHSYVDVLDDLSCNFEWRNLSKANIICVTVYNAIKRIKVIEMLKLPIVIVVEADIIPESYLIPFLNCSVEHLILVGHTEQPSLSGRKYDMSVSLYHRFLANAFPVSDLMRVNELEDNGKLNQVDICHILPCGHKVSLPVNEVVSSHTCQLPTYVILDCGHQIPVPCFESVSAKKRECKKIVTSVLPCNHSISYECCKLNVVNTTCIETTEVQLPCNHTVNIPCAELKEKREEYYSNGCYHICNAMLDCGHCCVGKCENCIALSVHKGCDKKCNIQLACGHFCQGLCNVPCPPCNFPCEWECSHKQCDKPCGEPCDPCTKQCSRICVHRVCDKLCWENCDKEPCEEPCQLFLECGHECAGICSEPCPSLCPACNADKCKELNMNEYSRILELDCGHVLNFDIFKTTLKKMEEQNERPTCPECKKPIRNKGYAGSFSQHWFQKNHERKMNINNLVRAAVTTFRFNPIVIKGQVDHSNVDSILDEMDNNCNLSYFVLGKINTLYIILLVRIINTVKSLEKFSAEHEILANKCQKLCSWIRRLWKNTSFEQLKHCSWEVYRLHQLFEIYKKLQKVPKHVGTKKSLTFIRLDRLCKKLEKSKQYTELLEKKVVAELTKLSKETTSMGSLFVKRAHPVTKEEYNSWLKGNVTREQLNWNLLATEKKTSMEEDKFQDQGSCGD